MPVQIPLNIQPKNVGLENSNLVIEWPDQVKSTYPSDWLYTHIHREQNDIHPPNSHNTVLWSGKTWSTSEAIPVRVDFNALESNDEVVAKQALKGLLTDIYKYGFALVENTPATAEATRAVAQKIGLLRMTIFGGDSWDYVIESHKETLLHSDTAYTPLDIKPHTDATFNWDPAGLQFFHCLEHVGEGGVNGLVDGWNVLTQLQQTNPDVYKYLTTEPLDFYYSDKKYAFHSHTPVARVNAAGAITAFKFNNHDRNPPHPLRTDLALYHKAVQTLEQVIENKDNSVAIKLLPGTVLITYGWRVLHSRTPFTGRRRMVGCYVGGDDFMSKYRVTSRTSDSDIQIH